MREADEREEARAEAEAEAAEANPGPTQSQGHNKAYGRTQGCQMAKFDPFLSLDCARVEGVGAQSKERKGSNFAA